MDALPTPDHFEPGRIGDVWRVDYEARFDDARRWSERHGLRPAVEDELRVALVAVDVQNTFCTPGFELFVAGRSGAGAVDDNRRLCEFLYRNLHRVTQIFPTQDTHQAIQIFHRTFLVDGEGIHPAPYEQVGAADVTSGRWRVNEAAVLALGLEPGYVREHLARYTQALERGGKYDLTVWPFHALLGGIGHALVSAVEEAIFFHDMARWSQAGFQVKGKEPLTEHYSMLGPEVSTDHEGRSLASRNTPLIDELLSFDAVIIAGQAKSHCVAWTIEDLLDDPMVRERRLEEKVYLLEDCTSPVVVPGVVDYTDEADAHFARFASSGAHVIRSTEPMWGWPGVVGEALRV